MLLELKLAILKRFSCQSDFAQALGVHESKISQVVRGRRELPYDDQKKWAEKLGRPVHDLFENDM